VLLCKVWGNIVPLMKSPHSRAPGDPWCFAQALFGGSPSGRASQPEVVDGGSLGYRSAVRSQAPPLSRKEIGRFRVLRLPSLLPLRGNHQLSMRVHPLLDRFTFPRGRRTAGYYRCDRPTLASFSGSFRDWSALGGPRMTRSPVLLLAASRDMQVAPGSTSAWNARTIRCTSG